MHDNEVKLTWWQKIGIALGLMYPPDPPDPDDEDGIILPGPSAKVLHFPRDTKTQIAVITPTSLNATQVPADFLKSGRAVLVNFHGLDKKIQDNARFFLSGITYAIDGSLQRVTETIYVFTPNEVGLICPSEPEVPEEKTEPVTPFQRRMFG
ncbi:MAG: cell division protein SepF [bacterium]